MAIVDLPRIRFQANRSRVRVLEARLRLDREIQAAAKRGAFLVPLGEMASGTRRVPKGRHKRGELIVNRFPVSLAMV